ncbi:MAG: tetratricopeptide repeat protein [Treponema sp.]|nr:tetratricopeptide repeat protein [Treponema sp.]
MTSIVFLPVPPTLKEELLRSPFTQDGEAYPLEFQIDPEILLPLELDEEEAPLESTISLERILSGMLKVIAMDSQGIPLKEETPPHWIDYYRSFVLTVKPAIFNELSSASIVKAANGEYDMALEICQILLGLFPRSPGVLLNRALIMEQRAAGPEGDEGAQHAALGAYEEALSAEPVLSDTLFNAAFFYLRRRDYELARSCFTQYLLTGEDEDLPEDKKTEAERILKEMEEQGLEDQAYRDAYEAINQGDHETGLVRMRDFIERYPRVSNGWFLLGWALRMGGRYQDALEALQKAAELGDQSCDLSNEIAICQMELGNLKEARKELERALRKEGENIKIISNLGVLALKSGNTEEAQAFFRTILALDPHDSLAKHYLGDLS